MDLLGFDVAKFEAITTAYCKLADQLGIQQVQFVPVSALQGDNIVHKSERTPWYAGEPLLTILENLPSNENLSERAEDFHFPVQLVSRLDQDKADDFRGYQGRIEAGSVSVGDTIRIEPNGYTSTVSEIISPNGIVQKAVAGEQVTIRLADDIDISRGDTFVAQHSLITATKRLTATVCWFDQRALNPARKYLLKHTTQTVFAKVTAVDHVLDVKTLSNSAEADSLKLNDIGELQLSLQKPITATTYAQNLSTGSFILIDEATYHTVAAGMILATE
ncbi:sulfate adenylyltransferase [Actinobacillus pleuropneumoniae]|nr:sulfate adenylyltransferase [Actinobacillus pleuropneumoniae]